MSPRILVIAAAILMLTGTGVARAETDRGGNPVEVGLVRWPRDFDAALERAERTGKPVFAFFQEVPGCGGCKKFGAEVMSHPAIVAAVQEEFVPVLIYNNRRGRDAELLQRFDEPAWNYQVVRFLDGTGLDLIPRRDRVWTLEYLARRMIEALDASGRAVPGYLEVAAYETDAAGHETAAFAQNCFWTGEYELGRIPGVITTEAGWLEGREVTLVKYHTDLATLDALVEQALRSGAADKVFLASDEQIHWARRDGRLPVGRLGESYRPAVAAHQKKQIQGSAFAAMNLSPMQRTKVNAFGPVDLDRALAWLRPEQRQEFGERSAGP